MEENRRKCCNEKDVQVKISITTFRNNNLNYLPSYGLVKLG